MQSLSKYQLHFHGTGTNNSNIRIKIQKTPNNQSNIDKKEYSWRHHTPWLPTITQNYSNQGSMVLL